MAVATKLGVNESVIEKPQFKDGWIDEIYRTATNSEMSETDVLKLFDDSPNDNTEMGENTHSDDFKATTF